MTDWRVVPAEVMLPIAEREARTLGLSRVADITGLDRLGVPCFQATRPAARALAGNISVLAGKGWEPTTARLAALMESIERHWAERAAVPVHLARISELRARGEQVIAPATFPLPLGVPDPGDAPLAWVRAQDGAGAQAWVPAHEVWCPFTAPPGAQNPPIWHSNGLAAGATRDEAAFHSLLEVIERDAVGVAELARIGTSVDLRAGGSGPRAALLERLAALDIAVEGKQVWALGGASAYAVALDDRAAGDPMFLVAGFGCHPDPSVALDRALLESVQTRATVISGAREDLDWRYAQLREKGYKDARAALAWWFQPTQERTPMPTDTPGLHPSAALADLIETLMVQQFRAWFVELSPPGRPVSVVRALIPGATNVTHGTVRLGVRVHLEKT